MSRTRPWTWDLALGVVLGATALLPLGIPGVELGQLTDSAPAWAVVVLVLVQTLPLAVRRRAPAWVLAVVGVGFAVAQSIGADTGVAGLGLLVALYSVGAHRSRHRWWTAAAALVAYAVLVVVLIGERSPERPVDWVTFVLVLALPWCLGMVVRDRVAGQQGREALAAERAVRAARSELARDLHDVVTHHVTAMVVHAESTAFGRDDTDATVLTSIGATGREALRELRALLDALDPATVVAPIGGRSPAGADVAVLVDRLAATGYPVTLTTSPDVVLPPDAARTVHDVTREAVTNAMKHAPGTAVRCVVRVSGHGAQGVVDLAVTNDLPHAGPAPSTGPPDGIDSTGGGRGVATMTERVRAAGGTVTIGPVGAEFRVAAQIPFHTEELA